MHAHQRNQKPVLIYAEVKKKKIEAQGILNFKADFMKFLPDEGLLRINQIVGDKMNPPIVPISKSSWWAGVKKGIYPAPIKLGQRTTVWRISDIRNLINNGVINDKH